MKGFSLFWTLWIALLCNNVAAQVPNNLAARQPEENEDDGPRWIPYCILEETQSEVTLGFAFARSSREQVASMDYDDFLDFFIVTYNELSEERCATNKLARVKNRKLSGPCSGMNTNILACASVYASGNINRDPDPFPDLRRRHLRRAISRASPAFVPEYPKRKYTEEDNACLCNVDPSVGTIMYERPTIDEFVHRYNAALRKENRDDLLPLKSIQVMK